MRFQLLTTALCALAGLFFPPVLAGAQPLTEPGRYSPLDEQPAILPEEVAPAAADGASPSVPLESLDLSAGTPPSSSSAPGGAELSEGPLTSPLPSSPRAGAASPSRSQPSEFSPPRRNAVPTEPSSTAATSPAFTPRASTKDLVAGMLLPPAGAELAGDPISLAEAMEGVYGRDRQSEIVSAYWHLTTAVARYHVAYRARAASPESQAELTEARLAAVRAQHRLAEVLQWSERRLPLPTSQPHSGSYNTRFDEIFVGLVSRRAWELDQTLPLLYDLMKARAEVVAADPARAAGSAAAYRFLDVVRDYNLAIAEYALLAAGDTLNGRQLVPLLIRVDPDEEEHVAESRDGLGKTSSRGNAPRAGSPRTAILDPQVRRTAGEESLATRGESSILTPPQQDRLGNAASHPSSSPSLPPTDQWRERRAAGDP